MTKPKLTLIRGLPGSGKSTLARKFADDGWKHFEADLYFYDSKGNYNFDMTRLGAAHEWCQHKTVQALADGFNVVVSNTFTTQRELNSYFEFAQDFWIIPQVISIHGTFGSIHNVPDEVMAKMRQRWVANPVLPWENTNGMV